MLSAPRGTPPVGGPCRFRFVSRVLARLRMVETYLEAHLPLGAPSIGLLGQQNTTYPSTAAGKPGLTNS